MTLHVSIPLEDGDRADLEAWARDRGVAVDSVVAEAVAVYVAERRELDAAIEDGLASIEAEGEIPHEKVVARLRERQARRDSAA